MSKLIDTNEMLELFYNHPTREYHIREFARLMKLSPTTATKYLLQLVKEGVLTKKEERNHILFSANTDNSMFKTKKRNYNLERIQTSGLIAFLEQEFNYPKCVILFGSYSKGENGENSDIDLFMLTETKKETNLERFEKRLDAKIELFIYDEKSFNNMKAKNKELLNNILNGIKLYGSIEVM